LFSKVGCSLLGERAKQTATHQCRPHRHGLLADQEPYTRWPRRGTGRDRIFAEPKLVPPLDTREAIRNHSQKRFGRSRHSIEK
jgi:hypothetical protein